MKLSIIFHSVGIISTAFAVAMSITIFVGIIAFGSVISLEPNLFIVSSELAVMLYAFAYFIYIIRKHVWNQITW